MNGTDLPGVNIYGECGYPYYYETIYFSYPEHLSKIKKLINEVLDIKGFTHEYMRDNKIPFIFPINDFYFMVIDNEANPIYYISTGYNNHDLNQPNIYCSLWADNYKAG